MKIEGPQRAVFTLSGPPPKTYRRRRNSRRPSRNPAPIFEPYQEALPLEAGYYSFVLDGQGRFRVERGNTRSHAGMVESDRDGIGAAGHFLITRAGKIGKVVCMSNAYLLNFENQHHVTVRYLIGAFANHPAFDLSRHATFQFSRSLADNFWISPDGQIVDDHAQRMKLAEFEGQGSEELPPFSPAQVKAFERYRPERPPRLYPLQQDHLEDPIDYDDHEPIEVGDYQEPYSPEQGRLTSGRKAFIFDHEGRLVVGYGHHLLAGGNPVGAAGQISVDEAGIVTEIHLNFSGHYRPPLRAEYARYTYRALVEHPLLEFADHCKINARGSFDMRSNFEMVSFSGGVWR